MLGCKLFVLIHLRASRIQNDRQNFSSIRITGCNPDSEIYNLTSLAGVLAQLVERLNGIEEVTGSNPVGSILLVHITEVSQRLRPCADQLKTIPACAVTNA